MHLLPWIPNCKGQKAVLRDLNATVPAVPQFLDWSEVTITFDHSDHPRKTHRQGKYPLVVNPLIDGYELSKILMDCGRSINILYIETLHRMKLHESQLSYNSVTFHGIVPGRQADSLGEITLDVTFGTRDNYQTEPLSFEVVPFKSAYHAIFGHPAY